VNDVIRQYRELLPTYKSFVSRLENLIVDLLKVEGIRIHFTESRVKTPESLNEKISRPGKSYDDPLNQIPDTVGVRVVLYYQDDVEKVGDVIKREFKVLEVEHSHQMNEYSPDQFGYLSVHYIVCLNKARADLTEWKATAGFRTEIQVRTVLQHSWAAISHALQYKREGDVPISLRRKLFRLAGLFELADEEFMELRDAGTRLVEESREIIKRNDDMARLDAPIVREFIASSPRFKEIMQSMIRIGFVFGAPDSEFEEEVEPHDYLGSIIEEFERLGLSTISDLNKLLAKDFGPYLADIVDDDATWYISDEFALFLLIIGEYAHRFSVKHLEETRGWHKSIAERTLDSALRHQPT
jgi:putative GTP pyrophosphokinase